MPKISLHQLGDKLRKKRGGAGIREAARAIGVSPATLSRVERGNLPDLDTFAKICQWLQIDPAEVLGVEIKRTPSESAPGDIVATAHFRTDQTMSPKLAKALADMIIAAERKLRQESSEPGG